MSDATPPPHTVLTPAGLLRRLGALVYDGLLLVGLSMVVTALFLPITGGEAVLARTHPWLEYIYRAVLLLLIVGFNGIAWTRSGQSLGMAAWRLRVEREDGALLTWTDTLRRLAAAVLSLLPLGLGYVWLLVDPDRRTWHDRLSRTRVIVLPKRR
jgi:uncharacterized RDD family membrane protein YckC